MKQSDVYVPVDLRAVLTHHGVQGMHWGDHKNQKWEKSMNKHMSQLNSTPDHIHGKASELMSAHHANANQRAVDVANSKVGSYNKKWDKKYPKGEHLKDGTKENEAYTTGFDDMFRNEYVKQRRTQPISVSPDGTHALMEDDKGYSIKKIK